MNELIHKLAKRYGIPLPNQRDQNTFDQQNKWRDSKNRKKIENNIREENLRLLRENAQMEQKINIFMQNFQQSHQLVDNLKAKFEERQKEVEKVINCQSNRIQELNTNQEALEREIVAMRNLANQQSAIIKQLHQKLNNKRLQSAQENTQSDSPGQDGGCQYFSQYGPMDNEATVCPQNQQMGRPAKRFQCQS